MNLLAFTIGIPAGVLLLDAIDRWVEARRYRITMERVTAEAAARIAEEKRRDAEWRASHTNPLAGLPPYLGPK